MRHLLMLCVVSMLVSGVSGRADEAAEQALAAEVEAEFLKTENELAPHTDPATEAWWALMMWDPLDVQHEEQTLMVRAKERRVTQTIYQAMILGICGFVGSGHIALEGVREIVIINQFLAQGWVFEGGAPECEEVSRVPLRDINVPLLSRSRLL